MSFKKFLTGRQQAGQSAVAQLSEAVAGFFSSRQINSKALATLALSTEAHSDQRSIDTLQSGYQAIETSVASAVSGVQDFAAENYQVEAATMAAVLAADPRAAMGARLRPAPDGSMIMASSSVPGSSIERGFSMESYNETDNRNTQMQAAVFNLMAPRQDAFGDALFPPVIISPTEQGVTLALRMFYVYEDFKRAASGAVAQYNRRNLIRAYGDTSILKNELTRGVPVLRTSGADQNTDRFVDVADVPAWTENLGVGVTVQTGALKIDMKHDLIGLSQTNELLESGLMGPTDVLDTSIRLTSLYVKVGTGATEDVIRLDVSNLPGNVFTYAPAGNYKRMILSMDTTSLVLGTNLTKVDGGALETLTELATHNARVSLNIAGSVTLDRGDGVVNRGQLGLVTLRNNAGLEIVGGAATTLAAKLEAAEIVGYTLEYFRANANLRQRGQLLDGQTEYVVIPVNYRSPLASLAPVSQDSAEDASALQSLIMGVGARISNDAVNTVLRNVTELRGFKAIPDSVGNLPEMSAIGHHLVKPTFFEESVNLAAGALDSMRSQDRFKDMRSALIEKIRFYATEMVRVSEYKVALGVMTGNIAAKPVVIIATDVQLHNYLTEDGDGKILGEEFDVKIVSTQAESFKGKIFVTFGVFGDQRNAGVNPLQYGHLLYSPEIPVTLNISRDGQTSKELLVCPRYSHYVCLPVASMLTVSGLAAATNKITVNQRTIV